MPIEITGFDHIVLCVANVPRTLDFYRRVLRMEPREERPGKWSLHFAEHKISLQDAATAPEIAKDTLPGSGNFCLLTRTSMAEVVATLERESVSVLIGPVEREGATGSILSVYFHDPDGNLVEVSNAIERTPGR
jgi:catechol 2,3-dioxygenase-like lactoylglutathione lyase family enzyme